MGTAAGPSEPAAPLSERLRRQVDSRPLALDSALAVVAFLSSVFVWARNGEDSAFRAVTDVPAPAFVVFAVAALALLRRRERPVLVFAVVFTCSGLAIGLDYGQVGVASLVSVYGVGRYASGRLENALVLLAAMAFAATDAVAARATVADAAGGVLVTCILWYAGRRVRHRGERADLLAREQLAQESRVLAEERARIARELHDIVAHRVSLMTVQAGAAKTVAGVDPQSAVQAMGAVEQAGREALGELRHLLGVLRPDRPADDLGPQPGLADVPRLVDQFRTAGLAVSLEMDPAPAGLPARVDLFAFRITQEAMTNVLKHAGPGATATVRITVDQGRLCIDIADDGRGAATSPSAAPGLPGSGHGLIGMRERAQLLDGTLRAGPGPAGGFQVAAVLATGEEST